MKPIIFSTPMVSAILEGRKTQTRRVIKPQCAEVVRDGARIKMPLGDFIKTEKDAILIAAACAPYEPGDVLWVRETWKESPTQDGVYAYKADGLPEPAGCQYLQWRSSRYMPRTAARIFLRVMDVRVERVQEISVSDALAEGIETERSLDPYDPVMRYKDLWDALNAKRGYGWETNPFVWVYTFERVNEDGTPCAP